MIHVATSIPQKELHRLQHLWHLHCLPAGGKLLALCGGFHKALEVDTRELAVLNLDTLTWDKPGTGRLVGSLKEHCALAVGRTKVGRPQALGHAGRMAAACAAGPCAALAAGRPGLPVRRAGLRMLPM